MKGTPRAWTWAALMHRAFALDVLACPHCESRLRLIATLHDPEVIQKIVARVGGRPPRAEPRPPPHRSPAPPRLYSEALSALIRLIRRVTAAGCLA